MSHDINYQNVSQKLALRLADTELRAQSLEDIAEQLQKRNQDLEREVSELRAQSPGDGND